MSLGNQSIAISDLQYALPLSPVSQGTSARLASTSKSEGSKRKKKMTPDGYAQPSKDQKHYLPILLLP